MFDEVKKIILQRCDQIVTKKTKLSELDMDSLDKMELLMDIEDVMDISIPENVLRDDITIGELIELGKPIEQPQKARKEKCLT